jgi:hypothetical protein
VAERTSTSGVRFGAAVAVVLVFVQFAAINFAPGDTWVRIALPLTIAIAPFALWAHRRHLGTWVIAVGLAANLSAILANGGLMPITAQTVEAAVGAERAAAYQEGEWIPGSKDVVVAPGEGRLLPLGDGIVVRAGSAGVAASPGDVVIVAGLAILVAEAAAAWALRPRVREAPAEVEPEGDLAAAA